LNAIGQIEKPITKGYFLAGGSLDFVREKHKDINPEGETGYSTDISIIEGDLFIGYFIFNNISLGLETDYFITRRNTNDTWNYIENDLIVGPSIRYYTKIGIFTDCFVGIGFLHHGGKGHPIKWRNYAWSTGVGYSLFINKFIALEPVISYRTLHKDAFKIEEGEEKYSGFNLSIGLQIYLKSEKDK
jgi:hypothetical protein